MQGEMWRLPPGLPVSLAILGGIALGDPLPLWAPGLLLAALILVLRVVALRSIPGLLGVLVVASGVAIGATRVPMDSIDLPVTDGATRVAGRLEDWEPNEWGWPFA